MSRSYKIKSEIGINGKLSNLLPNEDKISIMEKLLQMHMAKVRELVGKADTPSFICACASLIDGGRLDVYFNAMDKCKEMVEKEKKRMAM